MNQFDLPVPPSVNQTRKFDYWRAQKAVRWAAKADALLLATKYRPLHISQFELRITFSEDHSRMDLDNGLKCLIDYLRRIEAIVNDAPQNMRRLVVEWGEAPEGVRVQIIPWRAA